MGGGDEQMEGAAREKWWKITLAMYVHEWKRVMDGICERFERAYILLGTWKGSQLYYRRSNLRFSKSS